MPMPNGWDLPGEIVARLGERAGRQRAMVAEGHLLLVLHKVPAADRLQRQGVYFWRAPDGAWRAGEGGPGLPALRQHLEEFSAAVERLEDRYDAAETATEYFTILQEAVPLHRTAGHLYHTLQFAREAMPEARELIGLRDTAGDIDRGSELLCVDARNALDYRAARQSEEEARSAYELTKVGHRLNVLAALFLPLMALTGIFGMDLPHGLERAHPGLFWLIVLLGMAMGASVLRLLPRRTPERGFSEPCSPERDSPERGFSGVDAKKP